MTNLLRSAKRYLSSRVYLYKTRKKLGNRTHEDVFTEIFSQNHWGNDESVSGDGSTLAYTENIRAEIPKLIKTLGIRSILDAPCGDYNWFKLVERASDVRYIGGDIVSALIERNQTRYGNEDTRFITLDITKPPLPRADIWLCRDALFHFSIDDVFRALHNFAESEVEYILTSSHPACTDNTDIRTGDFRLLNLEIAPFQLPPPVQAIDDWIEGFPVRKLCLWRRDAIKQDLRRNAAYQRFLKKL